MNRAAYAARLDVRLPANAWQPGLGRAGGRLWEATAVRTTKNQASLRSRHLPAQVTTRRRVPASLRGEVITVARHVARADYPSLLPAIKSGNRERGLPGDELDDSL